ncbi:uncharacterized hydrolase YugF-like [Hylaeus volcanicus]|uniref:uncharacterized hydrolase YugF-like n=1 Tax=Hylaeus volcanicus TaxID=313075 RepID=UPI0023B86CC7|nr:uncharacterized hydrolase YugF-like [Hylaeus volcanicus]XP_053990372.1 uncharacterized hydrolase YugF-like [Hylaeus volcanicus]
MINNSPNEIDVVQDVHSVLTPKRLVEQDYPVPNKLYKKKILLEKFRYPYHYKHCFAGKNGIIHFNITGNIDNPIILCFHGLNGSLNSFLGFHNFYKNRKYCVISFDLYGHGLSANVPYRRSEYLFFFKKPNATYTLRFFVEQAKQLIDHLGVSSSRNDLTLVGFSMGGIIALSFALYYPSYVQRIFLICSAGFMKTKPPFRVKLLKQFSCCIHPISSLCICSFAQKKKKFFKQFTHKEIENGTAESLWTLHIWNLYIKKGFIESFLGCVLELPLWHAPFLFSMVGQLDIPVLCIWGENDKIVPPMPCDVVQNYIPNSFSLTIPQGTHLLINEKSTIIFKLLTKFLNVRQGEIVDVWSRFI